MAKQASDEKPTTRVDDDELVAMAKINKCIVTELENLDEAQQESVKLWIYNRHFRGFSTSETVKSDHSPNGS